MVIWYLLRGIPTADNTTGSTQQTVVLLNAADLLRSIGIYLDNPEAGKTLYKQRWLNTLATMNFRNVVCSVAALLVLTGCATTITNLTPSHLPRTPDNLYPFEVALETSQSTIRENSLEAFVLMGTDIYPMRPVQMLKNRWEAAVPIPAATNYVYYRYKFEYKYDRMGSPGKSSRLSGTYQLEIVDK